MTTNNAIANAISLSIRENRTVDVTAETLDAALDAIYEHASEYDVDWTDDGDGGYDVWGCDESGEMVLRLSLRVEPTTRYDMIVAAVEAADLCCPEQVCDALLALDESGGDWRAELEQAIARDQAERRLLGIDD